MQAAARLFRERLGHERRHQAVLHRHALGEAFVHDRIVGGPQGVGLVLQGQLDLTYAVFGDGAFEGHPLNVGSLPKVAKKVTDLGHLIETVDAV